MTTERHLKRNEELEEIECWNQLTSVYSEHANLKVLRKIVSEVVKVTGIRIKREQYRKKKGYVEYLQEHWEVAKRIALGITIDSEDIKQGPLAQKHQKHQEIQEDEINTIIQPQQMLAQQVTHQQNQYLQIPQPQPIQIQVSQNNNHQSQNDEFQSFLSNVENTSNKDYDFNGIPDENMYNFFDFNVRSDDDFYI